jgi:tetratricopeptide (TPR) repeat protein
MSQYSNPELSDEKARGRQRPSHIWELSLRPWGRALLFLAPIVALSSVLAWEAFRVARAAYKVDDISIPGIQKALQEDPGNADLLHRLGSVYTTDPSEGNLSEAVKYLQQAVEINPRRWDYWSDLGVACDFGPDTACSDQAFERAAALNPMTPAVLWALGNHYLLTNRPEKAFPPFRRLIALDPDYLVITVRLCLRATSDPQAIYSAVLAPLQDASPRFTFLTFLCSTADYESAMKIWAQMISGPDPAPSISLVKPFLDFLIYHNQIGDAETVWSDLQHAGIVPPDPPPQAANLLYNSGFEVPPVNTGFDWHVSSSPDLEIDLSDPSGYHGGKCLRIEFLVGRNAEYNLVDQMVRVKPNTRYQLTAYVRSNNLTSGSGPRLREVEMGCATCGERTSDPTVGTTPWHPIDVEFMTQPQTQAVRISFWRPRENFLSRDITGTVWLSGLTLQTLDPTRHALNRVRTR